MVRDHSHNLGDHYIETIYEIAGDVTPDDFPLTDDPPAWLIHVGDVDQCLNRRHALHRDRLSERGIVLGRQFERLAVQLRRVLLRPPAPGELRRCHELGDSELRWLSGLAPVTGERFVRLAGRRRRGEEACDRRMAFATSCRGKRLVGDVLDEGVPESELLIALDPETASRPIKPRSSSELRLVARSSCPPISASAPRQNTRPATDASTTTLRSSSGRQSSCAAMIARTLVGS